MTSRSVSERVCMAYLLVTGHSAAPVPCGARSPRDAVTARASPEGLMRGAASGSILVGAARVVHRGSRSRRRQVLSPGYFFFDAVFFFGAASTSASAAIA